MSSPIGQKISVDVSQATQIQHPQTIQKTSVAGKLPNSETVATHQKTKLESFKAGASEFLESSKGTLAIGSGATLIGLGVVSAIILAPITIPGAIIGASAGAALSKSKAIKDAFGGKGGLVKTGLTIGTCLTYGMGLLGAKLIEYGVNKNRNDKDNKAVQSDAKATIKTDTEENEISDNAESEVSAEKPLSKLSSGQLEQKLVEVKNNHLQATSKEYSDSLGDKIKTVKSQINNCDKQIDTEKESIAICNETLNNISDKYVGPGNEEFKKLLGSYMLTPNDKKEAYLQKLSNADVILTNNGNVTMDQIKRDLKTVNQNMNDVAKGNELLTKLTKQKSELGPEIKELENKLMASNDAYEKEVASLEAQIKSLSKPKLSDEEVLAQQMRESDSHRVL